MKLKGYFQVECLSHACDVMNRLASILHGIGREHGVRFAIAIPEARIGDRAHTGRILQVFSDEAIALIHDQISKRANIAEYIKIGAIGEVPVASSYTSYALFSIPRRSSGVAELRAKRLIEGARLPYFRVASKSTQQAFSVRVKPTKIEADALSDDVEPNSYGLSVASRAFSLPDVRVGV